MEIKEAVFAALKEIIIPKLKELKRGQGEFKAILKTLHKRLDDHNAHQ